MTLDVEFEFFLKNQAEFARTYSGRFIVIKDHEVLGDYATEFEAVTETSKSHEIGTFLVQKCAPGQESYTETFHSRVVFC